MDIILIYFAIKYKGDWDKIYKALSEKEKVSIDEINELEERIEKEKWEYITILQPHYPTALQQSYKPPFVIWLKGNIDLLKMKGICATGNNTNSNVEETIKRFLPELTKNHVLVTGSWKGVDQTITKHTTVGKIIVLANGVDQPYVNSDVTSKDLLLSEYPPTVHVSKERFRNRNRIIATMSKSLVLFSSDKDGGINNLVTNFLSLGKEIYCFPGDGSKEDGNSELIKQGANMITRIKDIES